MNKLTMQPRSDTILLLLLLDTTSTNSGEQTKYEHATTFIIFGSMIKVCIDGLKNRQVDKTCKTERELP